MAVGRKCIRRGCGKPLGNTKGNYCPPCRRANRRRDHDRHVTMNGFTGEDYWKLYEAQGGRCAIYGCKATGKTKHLSVDHDHKCDRGHPVNQWCRYCVRGLVCSRHNGWFGKAGDDPLIFMSIYSYLTHPPAQQILHGG